MLLSLADHSKALANEPFYKSALKEFRQKGVASLAMQDKVLETLQALEQNASNTTLRGELARLPGYFEALRSATVQEIRSAFLGAAEKLVAGYKEMMPCIEKLPELQDLNDIIEKAQVVGSVLGKTALQQLSADIVTITEKWKGHQAWQKVSLVLDAVLKEDTSAEHMWAAVSDQLTPFTESLNAVQWNVELLRKALDAFPVMVDLLGSVCQRCVDGDGVGPKDASSILAAVHKISKHFSAVVPGQSDDEAAKGREAMVEAANVLVQLSTSLVESKAARAADPGGNHVSDLLSNISRCEQSSPGEVLEEDYKHVLKVCNKYAHAVQEEMTKDLAGQLAGAWKELRSTLGVPEGRSDVEKIVWHKGLGEKATLDEVLALAEKKIMSKSFAEKLQGQYRKAQEVLHCYPSPRLNKRRLWREQGFL